MDALLDLINEINRKEFPPSIIISLMIARKFIKVGITLDDQQLEILAGKIEKHLEASQLAKGSQKESSFLEITEEWVKGLVGLTPEQITTLAFTERDFQEFEEIWPEAVTHATQEAVIKAGDFLFDSWKSAASKQLKKEKKSAALFKKKINEVWGEPLHLLEMLLSISLDIENKFNQQYGKEATDNDEAVFEALIRLHARGCQITRAVLVLLQNGLADDAHARWRTLHEIAVIASFILHHGNDVAIRYLSHSGITDYKEMCEYEQHCRALQFPPLSKEEKEEITDIRNALIQTFGENYGKGDYGWAAQILGKNGPKFTDIEQNAGLEYMRPFFKMANNNVHAGSKGVMFRLGDSPLEDVLVAGMSIFGLGEPGRNAAYSMMLLTNTLLRSKTSLDHLATVGALRKLMSEIHEAFYDVEEKLDE